MTVFQNGRRMHVRGSFQAMGLGPKAEANSDRASVLAESSAGSACHPGRRSGGEHQLPPSDLSNRPSNLLRLLLSQKPRSFVGFQRIRSPCNGGPSPRCARSPQAADVPLLCIPMT